MKYKFHKILVIRCLTAYMKSLKKIFELTTLVVVGRLDLSSVRISEFFGTSGSLALEITEDVSFRDDHERGFLLEDVTWLAKVLMTAREVVLRRSGQS